MVTGATEAQYGTKYNASGRWTYDYGKALILLGDVAITGYVLYRMVLSGQDATNKLFDFKNYDPLINSNDIMENSRNHMDQR